MAISPIGEDIGMNPPAGLEMLLGTDAWRMGFALWAAYGIEQHLAGSALSRQDAVDFVGFLRDGFSTHL